MKNLCLLIVSLNLVSSLFAQTNQNWTASGNGSAFSELENLTGLKPQSPCNNGAREDQIDFFNDANQGFVYRFYGGRVDGNYQGNSCSPNGNQSRARNEIRYDTSVPVTTDQKVQFKWKMKLPSNFKVTPTNFNFCHLHQLKYKNGSDPGEPLFTISAERLSNGTDYLTVIHTRGNIFTKTRLAQDDLNNFKGKWLEIEEIITYASSSQNGKYGIRITDIVTGQVLLEYLNNNRIETRKGSWGDQMQQKWGIYRSKPVPNDLQDESILFNDFEINYFTNNDTILFSGDTISLTSTPANLTIGCEESILPVNTGEVTAITACNLGSLDVTYTDVITAGSCANASSISRTWTVTDGCGNIKNHLQTIVVNDQEKPLITCPSAQTQITTNGVSAALNDYTTMVAVSDNCSAIGDIVITQSPAIGSIQNLGSVSVVINATDECGNVDSCTVTVNISFSGDTISLTATPANLTIGCEESIFPVNTGEVTAITACNLGSLDVKYTDVITAGSCANASSISRTWTVTDGCGNIKNHLQTIVVNDQEKPIITCPSAQTQIATNGVSAALNDYTTMVAVSDNCSSLGNIVLTQSPAIGSIQNLGLVSVVINATDECGNVDSCMIAVTVENAVGIDQLEKSIAFNIYPNPSNGKFYISNETGELRNIDLEITDKVGHVILNSRPYKFAGGFAEIDLTNESRGVYFLKIKVNEKLVTRRIIKTR